MWTVDCDKSSLERYVQAHPVLHWDRYLSQSAPQGVCFHGPEEGNLLHFCLVLAQKILCEGGDACGNCSGCKSFCTVDRTRFFPLFPQSQIITMGSVQELIHSQNSMLDKSQKQVFFIIFPDQFNKESANAILKCLEEPQPGRVFILVNPYSRVLLPTISSRVSHVYLPASQSSRIGLDQRARALSRLSDFDLLIQEEEIAPYVTEPEGLSQFYDDWTRETREGEFSVERLLFEQLRCGVHRSRRKIAVRSFVDELGVEEHIFLETELDRLTKSFKKMEALIRSRILILKDQRREEIGDGYEHWLLKDFSNSQKEPRIDQFVRGFITREIERILREVCMLFDDRFLSEEGGILELERQIRRNFSPLYTPHGLFDLQSELSYLFQMLRANVGWKQLLEQCGFLLLRFREGKDPVEKIL